MLSLDYLKRYTTVVVDTGDYETIQRYQPTDATTNPSLILAASKMPQYSHLITEAVAFAKQRAGTVDEQVKLASDKIMVSIGCEHLKMIPGRVSTEVDARLSFDVEGQVAKARHLICLYESVGISKDRILIKLSSTWEGIQAAKILERDYRIHCNLTLLFSLCQAACSVEASVNFISPYAGRITDWYAARTGRTFYQPHEDPGVKFVTQIYDYCRKFGYSTRVMGASFRNAQQVIALCGCDNMTIGPSILDELMKMDKKLTPSLRPEIASDYAGPHLKLNEKTFRWMLNEDEMATDLLSQGIRKFSADARSLEDLLRDRL